jgi:hypothetical protein
MDVKKEIIKAVRGGTHGETSTPAVGKYMAVFRYFILFELMIYYLVYTME